MVFSQADFNSAYKIIRTVLHYKSQLRVLHYISSTTGKSYKKGKIIIEFYKWGAEAMKIKIIFPNSFVSQLVCAYSEQYAEFPPAKKFIQETLAAL